MSDIITVNPVIKALLIVGKNSTTRGNMLYSNVICAVYSNMEFIFNIEKSINDKTP